MRTRTLLLILLTLGLSSTYPTARAQSFRWAQAQPFSYAFNPSYLDYAVAAQPDGGGWWVGLEEFHRNYSVALGALQLVRFNSTGTTRHHVRIGGDATPTRLLAGPTAVYLLGTFRDSIRFDVGHKLTPLDGNLTGFLAALDSTGTCRWVKLIAPPAGSGSTNAAATALAIDPRGGLLLGLTSGLSSYIQSLDPLTGAVLTTIPELNTRLTSVAADTAGNLFVAGSCAEPTSRFNGQLYPSPAGIQYPTYVACYGPSRAPRWVRYVEDITCSAPQVAVDGRGGVYFAGPLFGAYTFGALQAGGPTQGSLTGDFYLTHLDALTGTFDWLREVPQVTTGNIELAPWQNLAVDDDGRAYVAGSARGTIPWDATTTTTTAAFSTYELLTLCYEPTGLLAWAKTTNGSASGTHGLAMSVASSASGATVLLTGRTSPSFQAGAVVRFDTLTRRAAVGVHLPFVARLDAPARVTGLPPAAAEPFQLYPNPVAPGAAVRLPFTAGPATVTLHDGLGRLVGQHTLAVGAPGVVPAPVRAGLYLVRIRAAGGKSQSAQRLVVE